MFGDFITQVHLLAYYLHIPYYMMSHNLKFTARGRIFGLILSRKGPINTCPCGTLTLLTELLGISESVSSVHLLALPWKHNFRVNFLQHLVLYYWKPSHLPICTSRALPSVFMVWCEHNFTFYLYLRFLEDYLPVLLDVLLLLSM
jgi:hypothetical protein